MLVYCNGLKIWNASRICVSSLRRGHANLLCIVPILVCVLLKRALFLSFYLHLKKSKIADPQVSWSFKQVSTEHVRLLLSPGEWGRMQTSWALPSGIQFWVGKKVEYRGWAGQEWVVRRPLRAGHTPVTWACGPPPQTTSSTLFILLLGPSLGRIQGVPSGWTASAREDTWDQPWQGQVCEGERERVTRPGVQQNLANLYFLP